jgi:hypothetical protein
MLFPAPCHILPSLWFRKHALNTSLDTKKRKCFVSFGAGSAWTHHGCIEHGATKGASMSASTQVTEPPDPASSLSDRLEQSRESAADRTLSKSDLAIGTGIALAMVIAFTLLSSGWSLIVTFVPGAIFAWLAYLWMFARKVELPRAETFVPLFFTALAIQSLHFAEEFVTNFRTLFPTLYGGGPYSVDLFVCFNMGAYAVFTLSCLLMLRRSSRFLLMPVLFYVVYGAIGNAISHTWWVLYSQSYFPGFFTATAYWVFGPWLLYRLLGNWRHAAIVIIAFAAVLVPLTTIFMATSR